MWIPTPDAMVTRMLEAAKTTRFDTVYDLGAGEGRIPIAAAKQFGAKAVGIEYDAKHAALAKRNAERAGRRGQGDHHPGRHLQGGFSARRRVLTLYLLPDLNYPAAPADPRMKPGTRVVSHAWDMGEWEPDEAFVVEGQRGIPVDRAGARRAVAGRCATTRSGKRRFQLTQEFQRIGGTITIRGKTQPLLGAYVNGAIVGFTFVDRDGAIRSMRGQVDGDRIAGQLRFVGNITLLTGRKL